MLEVKQSHRKSIKIHQNRHRLQLWDARQVGNTQPGCQCLPSTSARKNDGLPAMGPCIKMSFYGFASIHGNPNKSKDLQCLYSSLTQVLNPKQFVDHIIFMSRFPSQKNPFQKNSSCCPPGPVSRVNRAPGSMVLRMLGFCFTCRPLPVPGDCMARLKGREPAKSNGREHLDWV